MSIRKLIIRHGLDLGDVAMLTPAIRDLHISHPGKFLTDVRTRFPDLWLHSRYITPLDESDKSVEVIDAEYGLIQNPGNLGFSDAFRVDLAEKLGVKIRHTTPNVYIRLTDEEKSRNIVNEKFGYSGKYWVLNAGYKADAVLKYYPYWQEVVEELQNDIQFVQVGAKGDKHDDFGPLVYSLVGETTVRELLQVIYRSEGTVGPLSMQFILATAWGKPSVIVAGGKEPPRWQMYNYHRYLHVCGCLPCAPDNGCWTAKYEDCRSRVGGMPRCFTMISPKEVARNVLLYYKGGKLKH